MAVRRMLAVLLAAVAFGVLASVVKGDDAGARDTLGNLSAPWLALPFAAAALLTPGRPGRGALVGVAATVLALAGFYVANAFVLDLGPHTRVEDLRLAVSAGQRYFTYAVVTGPLFGALGGVASRARGLALVVTGLFVLEPLAWAAYDHTRALRFTGTGVFVGEAALGVLACAVVAGRLRRVP